MLEEALWFAFRVGFGPAVWCFISQGQTSSPYHPQPAYPLEPGGCSPAQHWGGNSENSEKGREDPPWLWGVKSSPSHSVLLRGENETSGESWSWSLARLLLSGRGEKGGLEPEIPTGNEVMLNEQLGKLSLISHSSRCGAW